MPSGFWNARAPARAKPQQDGAGNEQPQVAGTLLYQLDKRWHDVGFTISIAWQYTPPQYILRKKIAAWDIPSRKKPLLARVRRIKGQAAAIERALEEGEECMAVLQQIAAIRGAVNGLMAEVLEGHLREHLLLDDAAAPEADPARQQEVDQVMRIVRSYLK
jgi:DNA-binding FrmR family transcriptional regulator